MRDAVSARILAGVAAAFILSACAHSSTNGSGPNTAAVGGAPQPLATMHGAGSLHVVLSAPTQTSVDLAAQCAFESFGEPGGGLRVLGRTPQASVALIGSSIQGDGDVAWKPDAATPLGKPPIDVNITIGDTEIYTGSLGSATTVHVAGGGRTGTATFTNATSIANDTIGSASGTLSWSCS